MQTILLTIFKLNFLKRIVGRLSATRFVSSAIAEKADLGAFKQRPGPRIIAGLSAITFSYLIGWPLIAWLGYLSVSSGQTKLLVLGGPAAYLLSHLVFMLGMYLAGAKYTWIFLRWLTRRLMLKLMRWCGLDLPDTHSKPNPLPAAAGPSL